MKTIAELTSDYRARGGNAADTPYAIGRNGGRAYAGTTGSKLHVLITNAVFGSYGACGMRNGGRVAIVPGLDTDAVTCSKCQKWIAAMGAREAGR